eukprot:101006_1
MFKCLCGGGTINNNPTNSKLASNAASNSIDHMPPDKMNKSQQKPHSPSKPKSKSKSKAKTKKKSNHTLDPNKKTEHEIAMTQLPSTSNQTTPSPGHKHKHPHLNGLSKASKKNIITASETENDDTTITSPSNTHRPKPKHVRKRTHPYKSRGDPHSSFSGTTSPIASPTIASGSISDYFVYENFEFSIETFDFNLHYKFLIELAIKCLDMGPETLSPSIFFKHQAIVCCVAILHQNNHKKVPKSCHKELINNVIGFCICYPHANCRPYPDSVWMIGFLCADHHRIRTYNSQYLVCEALMRSSYCLINPKLHTPLPTLSPSLKAHLKRTRDTKLYLNSHPIHREECELKETEIMDQKTKKKKRKPRDKGIGIYAPYHHKKAQQLYEALGFEKIAKISNYYSTDRAFLDEFYSNHSEEYKEKNNKKLSSDAYLYCRGDLAHCRLLLGMEYFNYKKWPKLATTNGAEDVAPKKKEVDDIKEDKGKEKEKKKRHHGPKILEEYLQERIAKYHAKQNEQLLRTKQQQQNKYSQQNNTNVNSVATVHKSTNQSSRNVVVNKASDKHVNRQEIVHHTNTANKAHHSSQNVNTSHRTSNPYNHHQNYQGHRSSGHGGYDKRMRYKQQSANTHQQTKRSSGHAAAAGYYDDYHEAGHVQGTSMNGTLSPNMNALHKNASLASDGGGGGKSSRHSSAANSQISHHNYHAAHNSGHYYHPHAQAHPHSAYHHQQRPTYTQSSNAGSSGGQRSSVTPTPTYHNDVTHSQAIYNPPYLSNVSTASHASAYTHSMAEDHGIPRGNSFYSTASSHHSHQSNASMHSDHPYHHPQGSYHRHSSHQSHPHTHYHMSHPSHQSHHSGHHHDAVYGHPNQHRHPSHHKHHESYNDDPYQHHSQKPTRNKRYTRSSRHSSHKKLPQ